MFLSAIDNNKKFYWKASSCHCFQYHESKESFLQNFWKSAEVKKKKKSAKYAHAEALKVGISP